MAKLIKLFSQIFQQDHRNEVEGKIKRHEEIWSDIYPASINITKLGTKYEIASSSS